MMPINCMRGDGEREGECSILRSTEPNHRRLKGAREWTSGCIRVKPERGGAQGNCK